MLVIKKGTGSFEQLNTEELKKIVSTSLGYDIEKYKKNSFEFVIKGKRDFFKKLHVFPNKTFLKNSFTVTMNGESITYGYCRRLVIANKSGFSEQVLDPERDKDLYIKGRSKIVSKDNLDLVAYMLLYPECGTSEFSKSDKYSLNNVVKSASSNIASLRKTTEWKNKILNTEDLDRLTNFLQSTGHRGTHLMEEEEIRLVVLEIAEKDLTKFLRDYNSQDVNVRSDAQRFIDENYLTYHEFSGRMEWRVNIGDKKGFPIADVKKGEDKFEVLLRELVSNYKLYDELKTYYLNDKSVSKSVSKSRQNNIEKEPSDVTEEHKEVSEAGVIARGLIDKEVVRYSGLLKTVSIYKDGKKVPKSEGGDLLVSDEKHWVGDFLKWAEDNIDKLKSIE